MTPSEYRIGGKLNEAVELLHTDIKQEAANCMESAVKALNKVVEEGKSTSALAHTAADMLGEHGKAFSYIAEEVSKSFSLLKRVSEDFSKARNLSAALSQLSNSAYVMNMNAFNAAMQYRYSYKN